MCLVQCWIPYMWFYYCCYLINNSFKCLILIKILLNNHFLFIITKKLLVTASLPSTLSVTPAKSPIIEIQTDSGSFQDGWSHLCSSGWFRWFLPLFLPPSALGHPEGWEDEKRGMIPHTNLVPICAEDKLTALFLVFHFNLKWPYKKVSLALGFRGKNWAQRVWFLEELQSGFGSSKSWKTLFTCRSAEVSPGSTGTH